MRNSKIYDNLKVARSRVQEALELPDLPANQKEFRKAICMAVLALIEEFEHIRGDGWSSPAHIGADRQDAADQGPGDEVDPSEVQFHFDPFETHEASHFFGFVMA